MRKQIACCLAILVCVNLYGCAWDSGSVTENATSASVETKPMVTAPEIEGGADIPAQELESSVRIRLNGDCVAVDDVALDEETGWRGVSLSRDIIYYEEKTAYESGNPYGEGSRTDMHSAEEAEQHLVVNITEPGNYRLSGMLTLGQIRIDLGDDACEDPDAVVNLILDGVDITCTVAPAILFQNVYECDGAWSKDTAAPEVDTSAAGANLILGEGSTNTVNGAYVAKIFKDKDGEKKLWKQDGAIYSYMSMNVCGPGSLMLNAENEGIDTELHLTINGGNITIRSGNDGINTNEDGVSVTTINAGHVHIIAGLGKEGDGIDSNGYLVINGGTVVSAAHPASDAGLDSNLGSYIHGGTVIALGSAMDWAESDSDQVTMNLQFASYQSSAIVVTQEDGTAVFAYDPGEDEVLGENVRQYLGAVISSPYFRLDQGYHVYLGGEVTGEETGGIYDASTVTGYTGGVQQSYTGSDVGMGRPGGKGHRPGNPSGNTVAGEAKTIFFMQDKVNAFSGVSAAE